MRMMCAHTMNNRVYVYAHGYVRDCDGMLFRVPIVHPSTQRHFYKRTSVEH